MTSLFRILRNKGVKSIYGMFAGKPEYTFSDAEMLRDLMMEKYNSFDKSKFSNHLDSFAVKGIVF